LRNETYAIQQLAQLIYFVFCARPKP